ncbi:MAG TPA: response regulator [Azospirillaceae bacterium]|nr:response regulator [Azospirillaceae bacterium]
MRVLVVEDEFLIALSLSEMIQGMGYRPLGPARSVAEARELLAAETPDAAMLDCRLRDGLSAPVAELLRGRGVPFVWLTGYEQSDLPRPGEPVLRKPATTDDMERALRALLDGRG